MGKQINFYMSEKVQTDFIKFLEQKQFLFLDNKNKIIIQPNSKSVLGLYLYKQDYGNIIMNSNNSENLDCIKSPVIQFSKTIVKDEYQKVLRGRLWMTDCYNDEAQIVKKGEAFVKDYRMVVRWIKKYVPYQEIKKGDFFVKEYVSNEMLDLQDKGFVLTL